MRTHKRRLQQLRWSRENREIVNKKSLERIKKNLLTWVGYFPSITACPICGNLIGFLNIKNPIAFDHRHEGKELIKGGPTAWLGSHPRTDKNEEIFKSCDFGILCKRCNTFLPTKGRLNFLIKALAYVNLLQK